MLVWRRLVAIHWSTHCTGQCVLHERPTITCFRHSLNDGFLFFLFTNFGRPMFAVVWTAPRFVCARSIVEKSMDTTYLGVLLHSWHCCYIRLSHVSACVFVYFCNYQLSPFSASFLSRLVRSCVGLSCVSHVCRRYCRTNIVDVKSLNGNSFVSNDDRFMAVLFCAARFLIRFSLGPPDRNSKSWCICSYSCLAFPRFLVSFLLDVLEEFRHLTD